MILLVPTAFVALVLVRNNTGHTMLIVDTAFSARRSPFAFS